MSGGLGGLDRLRLLAALLVVAIHTSPLGSVSELGDFLLCRVAARLAVPFFFMVTGYFLLPEYIFGGSRDWGRLGRFCRRLLLLYGAAVLLYLPVNIYAGQWRGLGLGAVLRRLLFEGTLYHLWYLPAALLGVGVALWLGRRLPWGAALGAGAALYGLGLLGDSYWGFVEGLPVCQAFYGLVFAVMGYTRSGLFMAPVFLLLGAAAARDRAAGLVYARSRCLLWFGLAFGLLLAEGAWLHSLGVQRHDSMYLALLPCLLWLFRLGLCWECEPSPGLRQLAALIYLLHPLGIIGLRGLAGALGLDWLLVHSKPVFYLGVCGLAAAGSWALLVSLKYIKKDKKSSL